MKKNTKTSTSTSITIETSTDKRAPLDINDFYTFLKQDSSPKSIDNSFKGCKSVDSMFRKMLVRGGDIAKAREKIAEIFLPAFIARNEITPNEGINVNIPVIKMWFIIFFMSN